MERKTANFALCCSCICISYLNMIYMDIISNGIALKKYHLYNFNKFSPFYIKKVNNFLLFHWMKGKQRNRLKTNQRLEVDLIKSVFMVGKINSVTFFFIRWKVRSWWRRQNSNKSHKVTSPVCELIYCLKQQLYVLVNNKIYKSLCVQTILLKLSQLYQFFWLTENLKHVLL